MARSAPLKMSPTDVAVEATNVCKRKLYQKNMT